MNAVEERKDQTVTTEHTSLLKHTEVTSKVDAYEGLLAYVFDVDYAVDGYHILVEDFTPGSSYRREKTLEWKQLFLRGSYQVLPLDDFLDSTALSPNNITDLVTHETTLSGMPYLLGVHRQNRLYTPLYWEKQKQGAIQKLSQHHEINEGFTIEDSEPHVVTLDDSDAELYNALTKLGLAPEIAFKITLSLTEYSNTVEMLEQFMASGMSFRYDSSTHLTLFEVYVYLSQYFGRKIVEQTMESNNFSMQYLTMLWIVMRRGGDQLVAPEITSSMQDLDSRSSGVLLTMLERGMLTDYTRTAATLRILAEVDWEKLMPSVDEYITRLMEGGLVSDIRLHFSLSHTDNNIRTYYAEAQEAFMTGEYPDKEATKAYMEKVKSEREHDLMMQTYLPLIAHFADNATIRKTIDDILQYQRNLGLPRFPVEALYSALHFHHQGIHDIPIAWILAEYTLEDESLL